MRYVIHLFAISVKWVLLSGIILLFVYSVVNSKPNELSVRQWSWRPGFSHSSSYTKDSKMVVDAALVNTQHYKVRING